MLRLFFCCRMKPMIKNQQITIVIIIHSAFYLHILPLCLSAPPPPPPLHSLTSYLQAPGRKQSIVPLIILIALLCCWSLFELEPVFLPQMNMWLRIISSSSLGLVPVVVLFNVGQICGSFDYGLGLQYCLIVRKDSLFLFPLSLYL